MRSGSFSSTSQSSDSLTFWRSWRERSSFPLFSLLRFVEKCSKLFLNVRIPVISCDVSRLAVVRTLVRGCQSSTFLCAKLCANFLTFPSRPRKAFKASVMWAASCFRAAGRFRSRLTGAWRRVGQWTLDIRLARQNVCGLEENDGKLASRILSPIILFAGGHSVAPSGNMQGRSIAPVTMRFDYDFNILIESHEEAQEPLDRKLPELAA